MNSAEILKRKASEFRRRAVDHLKAGTSDYAPGNMLRSSSVYTDTHRFDQERKSLFLRHPIIAGLSAELPAPGDGKAFEVLGQSILLMRAENGTLHAFRNICRHRGAKIIPTRQSDSIFFHQQTLTCPFHGWTYGPDGRLCGVPQNEAFDGADFDDLGLYQFPAAEHCGLVFVGLSPEAEPEKALSSNVFMQEIAALELETLSLRNTVSFAANCNWKLAIDTYCENYHFPALHAGSIGHLYISNISVFDENSPNWRIHFPEKSLISLLDRPETEWPEAQFSAVYFLFPSTVLVAGSGDNGSVIVRLFTIFPGKNPDQCQCTISEYRLTSGCKLVQNAPVDEVTLEDFSVAETVQANMTSTCDDFRMLFGRNEPALQAFHRAVDNALANARDDLSP